jgi:hypothetical protein
MSITINGATNTLTAASGLAIAGNTAVTGTLSATGQTNLDAGTVAAPGLVLEGETGTGLYRIGANNHGYAVSGAKVLDIASTALTLGTGVNLTLADGKAVSWGASNTYIQGSTAAGTLGAYVGATKIWEIDGSGATTYSYDIKMASGQGIDFSATANGTGGSAINEILSDFEEGDFTPTVNSFTTTGTYTATGKYTKIGRQVTVLIKLVADTGTIAAVAGTSYFAALPYTCGQISSAQGGVVDEATFVPAGGGYVPAGLNQLYPSAWAADANTRVISASYFV